MFTILDDKFLVGYKVFMKSFLHFNPWFDLDFVILDNGLSPNSKSEMKKMYSKLVFKRPNYDKYKKVDFSKTHNKLKATYFYLDAFAQYEYDKVVSVDVDMVVLDSMKTVFHDTCDGITGCKAYNRRKDRLVNDINAGLFVVGKKFLNEKTYDDLLEIAKSGHTMPEQKTMNMYFKGRYNYLNKRFNIEKRMLHSKKYPHVLENPAVIHYVAIKPWEDHSRVPKLEQQYGDLERHWWKWYKKLSDDLRRI